MSQHAFYTLDRMPSVLRENCEERVRTTPSDDDFLLFFDKGMDYLIGLIVTKAAVATSRTTLVHLYDRGNEVARLAVIHRLIELAGACDNFTAMLAAETVHMVDSDAQLRRLYGVGNESVKLAVVLRFLALRKKCDASTAQLALDLVQIAKNEDTLDALGTLNDPAVDEAALLRMDEIKTLPMLIDVAPTVDSAAEAVAPSEEGDELSAAARAAVLIVETDGALPEATEIAPAIETDQGTMFVLEDYADEAAHAGSPVIKNGDPVPAKHSLVLVSGANRTPKGYDFDKPVTVVGPSTDGLLMPAPRAPSEIVVRGSDVDALDQTHEAEAVAWAVRIVTSDSSPEELYKVMTRAVLRNKTVKNGIGEDVLIQDVAGERLLEGVNTERMAVSDEIEASLARTYESRYKPRAERQRHRRFAKAVLQTYTPDASIDIPNLPVPKEMVSSVAQREEILRRLYRS